MVFAAACGEPLVDGRYTGEPLFRLEARVDSLDAPKTDAPTLIGVGWMNLLQDEPTWTFQAADVSAGTPPFGFELNLYRPPDEAFLNRLGGEFAGTGFVFAFEDVDRNGDISDGEIRDFIRGGSVSRGVVYFSTTDANAYSLILSRNLISNPEAIREGFHLVQSLCGPQGPGTHVLEIIPNEVVSVTAATTVESDIRPIRECIEGVSAGR